MAKPARPAALQNGGAEHAALLAQASGLPKSALAPGLDAKAKARHVPGQQRGWLKIDSRGNIDTVQVVPSAVAVSSRGFPALQALSGSDSGHTNQSS